MICENQMQFKFQGPEIVILHTFVPICLGIDRLWLLPSYGDRAE